MPLRVRLTVLILLLLAIETLAAGRAYFDAEASRLSRSRADICCAAFHPGTFSFHTPITCSSTGRHYHITGSMERPRKALEMQDGDARSIFSFIYTGTALTSLERMYMQGEKLHKRRTLIQKGAARAEEYLVYEAGAFSLKRAVVISPAARYVLSSSSYTILYTDAILEEQNTRKAAELGMHRKNLIPIRTGASNLYIQHTQGARPGLTWLFVHPNEYTAYAATKAHVLEHGGEAFLFLGAGTADPMKRERHFPVQMEDHTFHLDANRIFSDGYFARHFYLVGRLYGYTGNNMRYFPRYGQELFLEISRLTAFFYYVSALRRQPVIVVHDNDGDMDWPELIFRGRHGRTASAAHRIAEEPHCDFFYTTDRALYNSLKNTGFNCILQNNRTVYDDGSASVFFAQQQMPYISIEITRDQPGEESNYRKLRRMLLTLQELIMGAAE